ncbi:MAG: hypothetical protein GWN62_11500 [Aliifodinibius sp.]|nr:hypothetical protein [Fodinibius sp.]
MMAVKAYSIAGINNLDETVRRDIFLHMVPDEIFKRFSLPHNLVDNHGNNLLLIEGNPGSQSLELRLFHEAEFQDPILYCHMVDTLNGQIHVLLYIMNDPFAPRFNIDVLPDGTKTAFGTRNRNLDEELKAMEAGLLPGQIRRGLNILSEAVLSFENFIQTLGQNRYFNEPLYYHNAIIFERYGFSYQMGKRKMASIHSKFLADDEVISKLGSTPFRRPEAQHSIFYRSWAIHDGILGEKFDGVTMYKIIGRKGSINTAPGIHW